MGNVAFLHLSAERGRGELIFLRGELGKVRTDLRKLFIVRLNAGGRHGIFLRVQVFQPLFHIVVLRQRNIPQSGTGTGFIQQIDCLVRKVTVVDIPFGKRDDTLGDRIGNMDAVIILVIGFDTREDADAVVNRRLRNGNRLKTTFQGGVLFDIFAVLRKRRRTDHLDFSAGKRGFQNICGIHGTFRVSGADEVVHFVDKEDDVPLRLHFVKKALDSAFKLAAELRPRNERRKIQQMDFFFLQTKRNVSIRHADRQTFRNGRFAHPGFPDQARVVFRPAAEDLDDALDLFLPPDYGVDFAGAGLGGKVGAVSVQMLALCFMFFPRCPAGGFSALHLFRRIAGSRKHIDIAQGRHGSCSAWNESAQGIIIDIVVRITV